jgi:hypothetical protein
LFPCSLASREFIEIDNKTYYIDITGIHRDDSKTVCESVNMTMISFEGDEQKWYSVNRWLYENGMQQLFRKRSNHNLNVKDYVFMYFWTDALRDENSIEWYWETTGNSLTENDFYWGVDQPSMGNSTVRSCISFRYTTGGYDDDDCLDYVLASMCQ